MGIFSEILKAGNKERNNKRKIEQDLKRIDSDKLKQRFVKHEADTKVKINEVPAKLDELFKNGITKGSDLKPSYNFTSSTKEGAERLQKIFDEAKYETNPIQEEGDQFVLSGKSYSRKTDDVTIQDWIKNICLLGFQNHCEFQDWTIDN